MSKIIPFLTAHRYSIGFFDRDYLKVEKEERYGKVHWLELGDYDAGWFADPFFLEIHDNTIVLLSEEYIFQQHKGRISLLEIEVIGGKYILKRVKVVLESKTHLSFPYIIKNNGEVYVLPENIQNGKTIIYKYDSFNESVDEGHVLIDLPLADPCLFDMNGFYFLMGTGGSEGNRGLNTHLEIYSSESLMGPYKRFQCIDNERSIERGAGAVFYWPEGRLIRPTQCCENRYGEFVYFNELQFLNGSFTEQTVFKLEPDYRMPRSKCLHTFNVMEDLCVIDGLTYRFSRLGPFVIRVLNILFG